MNVKLLEEVRDRILAHPEDYDQGQFCGTAYCIAGHAVMLANPELWKQVNCAPAWERARDAEKAGAGALDLTEDQADRLFDPYWGGIADGRFDLETIDRPRHLVAADRINHFIATGGAE